MALKKQTYECVVLTALVDALFPDRRADKEGRAIFCTEFAYSDYAVHTGKGLVGGVLEQKDLRRLFQECEGLKPYIKRLDKALTGPLKDVYILV